MQEGYFLNIFDNTRGLLEINNKKVEKGTKEKGVQNCIWFYKKKFIYGPFRKTLPRSSSFVNWISARFYITGCTKTSKYV